jgi:hypothetical protein
MTVPVDRKLGFWDRVQQADPRILYLLFAVLMIALEFRTVSIPTPVPAYVQRLYDHIESMPADKIVILDSSMDAGWFAEARGTVESVVRHLFRRGIRFAVFTNTTYYQGQQLGPQIINPIAREMGKTYGVDYCVWGAVVLAQGATLQAVARDFAGQVKVDMFGTPLAEVPMMRQVRDIRDVGLVYSVCYGWEGIQWIGFIQAVYGTPYAVGTSAISSSTAFPYIDSHQMIGLLPGASGAASYERLLDEPGSGTRIVAVQSLATLYVVLAILLGNVAMGLARLQAGRTARRGKERL